ncbi:MAG: hypothetical protein JO150_13895 [Acidobacteriaceae bacterium]|nr:hypothetical protein [Acidobacteriaceae bacterium]
MQFLLPGLSAPAMILLPQMSGNAMGTLAGGFILFPEDLAAVDGVT